MMPMRLTVLALVALTCLGAPLVALADDPNLSYDDPGMHFSAPDGWQKQDVGAQQQGSHTAKGVVAAFTKDFGRYDIRSISIRIEDFSGSLDGLEGSHESDLRGQGDSVFIDKKQKVTLNNGMPAWLVKVSIGSEPGRTIRDIEYVVYDGRRSIIASYVGRSGAFDDKDALAALSTLSVVLYPSGR
jgi:hypothetical protein